MIEFFYHGDPIEIPEDFDKKYLKYLNDIEKIEIINEKTILLKDFSGYIGNILYIPKKLKLILNFESNEQYKQLLDNLLAEILEQFGSDRLFQLFSTNTGLIEDEMRTNPLFQLNTLISHRDTIIFALQRIAKNPHRRLIEENVYREFQNISYVDETVMLNIFSNPYNWQNNSPRRPLYALQYNNFESVDTVENRFFKKFINDLSNILDFLLRKVVKLKHHKILLNGLKYEIENFNNDFPFDEVGEMKFIPYTSQVLMKRDGYHEVFYIYNKLLHSFNPTFTKTSRHSIALKDLSSLWEYYVMSKLINIFGFSLKEEFKSNLEIKGELYEQATIKFRGGKTLYFQHVFESYSKIKFRPDFYFIDKTKKIVIDAKFRIFDNNRTEILKNMHYYRDGLQVDLAIAILIGNENYGEIFTEEGKNFEVLSLAELFKYRGIGYWIIDIKELVN